MITPMKKLREILTDLNYNRKSRKCTLLSNRNPWRRTRASTARPSRSRCTSNSANKKLEVMTKNMLKETSRINVFPNTLAQILTHFFWIQFWKLDLRTPNQETSFPKKNSRSVDPIVEKLFRLSLTYPHLPLIVAQYQTPFLTMCNLWSTYFDCRKGSSTFLCLVRNVMYNCSF